MDQPDRVGAVGIPRMSPARDRRGHSRSRTKPDSGTPDGAAAFRQNRHMGVTAAEVTTALTERFGDVRVFEEQTAVETVAGEPQGVGVALYEAGGVEIRLASLDEGVSSAELGVYIGATGWGAHGGTTAAERLAELGEDLAPCQLIELGQNGPSVSDAWLNQDGNGPMVDCGVGLTARLEAPDGIVVAVELVADRAARAATALRTRKIGGRGWYSERRSFFFE